MADWTPPPAGGGPDQGHPPYGQGSPMSPGQLTEGSAFLESAPTYVELSGDGSGVVTVLDSAPDGC